MNKKSQFILAKSWILPAAYIAFIIFFIVFFIFIKKSDSSEAIKSQMQAADLPIALVGYLRTPVQVENMQMTMADLIVLWNTDKKYEQLLALETKKILDSMEYESIDPSTKQKTVHRYELDVFSKPGFDYKSNLFKVKSANAKTDVTCDDARCTYFLAYFYLPLNYMHRIRFSQALLPLPGGSSLNVGLFTMEL